MRITKTIREYVTQRVGEVYRSKIEELEELKKDKNKEVEEKIKEIEKIFNEKILELAQEENIEINPFRIRFYGARINDEEIDLKIVALNRDKQAKVVDILGVLELGGNKKDLEELLANL